MKNADGFQRQRLNTYAKRTLKRALPATRKRFAHRLADIAATSIQNEAENDIQNDVVGTNREAK